MKILRWLFSEDGIQAIFMVILAAIAIFAVVVMVNDVLNPPTYDPCHSDKTSFTCFDQRMTECIASERYSEQQCAVFAAGGDK